MQKKRLVERTSTQLLASPSRSVRASHNPASIQIYDPKELRRAIDELERDEYWDGFAGPDDETPSTPREAATLSAEDLNRLKALKRIAQNRLGPSRHLIQASPAMLRQLEAIKTEAPHFEAVIDLVFRAAKISLITRTPLTLPPTLLVGKPGIGKTFVLKRIAKAIGTHFEFLAANTLDSFRLRGLNTAWKGARAGKIAETMLKSQSGSPVILLDEFACLPRLNASDRPYDLLLSIFEEENAERFVDDYLEVSFRANKIIWFASANTTDELPGAIIDRMLILQIPSPTTEQLGVIVDGIYEAVRTDFAGIFAPTLSTEVRIALSRHNPRRLKRIVRLAFGFAVIGDRQELAIADVEQAARLGERAPSGGFSHPVGFTVGAR